MLVDVLETSPLAASLDAQPVDKRVLRPIGGFGVSNAAAAARTHLAAQVAKSQARSADDDADEHIEEASSSLQEASWTRTRAST